MTNLYVVAIQNTHHISRRSRDLMHLRKCWYSFLALLLHTCLLCTLGLKVPKAPCVFIWLVWGDWCNWSKCSKFGKWPPLFASVNSHLGFHLIDANALVPDKLVVNFIPFLSLNLSLPVLCKMQCFDYNNFMEMNSRRPSWRCPHCNQSVCHPEIRICQDIAKASCFCV